MDEEMRAQLRAVDPLYDQREEMPVHEFDGVHYFLNQPRRSPPYPPVPLVYLDSNLTPAAFADRFYRVLADLDAVLADTVDVPMHRDRASWFVVHDGEHGGAWSDETLAAIQDALRTGLLTSLGVEFWSADRTRSWSLACWCPSNHRPGYEDPAIELSLVPDRELWPAGSEDSVAERLLALLASWAQPLDLRTGCVTLDRTGPAQSPYDAWYGLTYTDTAPLTRERVRGYYWANLLTAGHIDRLGGLDALRNKASAAGFTVGTVEPAGTAPPALVLRAPGPLAGFDDTQLAAVKQLLTPVLISRPYTIYQGYPLRIVPDPGTAFRRVPAGAPMPRLLPAHGVPPSGG